MLINEKKYRTIWESYDNPEAIHIIDQTKLPHRFVVKELKTVEDFFLAISTMEVRGAPLIGGTAAYAMHAACIEAGKKEDYHKHLHNSAQKLISSRPTAINLRWAVNKQMALIDKFRSLSELKQGMLEQARQICNDDAANCEQIGLYGMQLIRDISHKKSGDTVNILTHCNAGWLATIDWGTATAPIYKAHKSGIDIHVWVDETRPRNQGAKLTSYELNHEGVPNTIIVDNAGGHLMQHGMVDIVIVGSDRTSYTGDVANKIGTYLKALAAKDNNIPFYVALPSSTIDWKIKDGISEIPIEQRNSEEVRFIDGLYNNDVIDVLVTPVDSIAANFAFDVTPSRIVSGLITERGICSANETEILNLFPEHK